MLESAEKSHQRNLTGISRLKSQLTFRISVLSKLLDRQMAEIAAREGLSLGAYRMLATIDAFETLTAADLVRYTAYDKGAVSRLLAELDARGLVEGTIDPNHGRRKLLVLTATGHSTLIGLEPLVHSRRDRISAQLTAEEERHLTNAIEKLATYLSDSLPDQTSTRKGD